MKLHKTVVATREAFITDLFVANPNLSVATANDEVKAKFGSKMRATRAYALREAVRSTTATAVTPTTTETVTQVAVTA